MARDFVSSLRNQILVCDGAMGTRLQALTHNTEACIDGFNIDPALAAVVKQTHAEYRAAGARILQTNTYGANAVKLARHGLEEKVRAINAAGVALAREAAGADAFVFGSVGPLELAHPGEDLSVDGMRAVFRDQMEPLVSGGADALILETFQDFTEARTALDVAKGFGIPIVFQFGGVQQGRTVRAGDIRPMAVEAARAGAAVIGSNCRGPYDILETTRILAGVVATPLSAQPNAGSPEIDRGRVVYTFGPADFGAYVARLVEAGATLLGGCCGTDPRHIAAIAAAAAALRPAPRKAVSHVHVAPQPATRHVGPPRRNPVDEVFAEEPFVVSVEMRASVDRTLDDVVADAEALAEMGVTLFDVPDNAGARVAIDPLVTAARIQERTSLPTLIHLGTTHRNLVATQSYLLGCWYAGVQGILAVTGDHPDVGDHDKYAERVGDVKSSVHLIKLIQGLNEGRLFNGKPLAEHCNLSVGAGLSAGRDLKPQIRWLDQKIAAGARWVYTQPLFRAEDVDRLLEATAHVKVPILVGVMPLMNLRNAEFFASGRIPGILVPESVLSRFSEKMTAREGRQCGEEIAHEMLAAVRGRIRGIYIIPPVGNRRMETVERIVKAVRAPAP